MRALPLVLGVICAFLLACAGLESPAVVDSSVTCEDGDDTAAVSFEIATTGDIATLEVIVLDGSLEVTRVDCFETSEGAWAGSIALFLLDAETCEDASALDYRVRATGASGEVIEADAA